MSKGQSITKEEMSVILNEAFRGFRQEMKGEIAESFVEIRKEIRKDIIEVVSDFHEKVEVPMMDEVLGRLGKIEKRLGGVEKGLDEVKIELKNEVGRLERKLDKVTDHQAEKLDDHEGRIIRLEAIA